MNDNAETIQAAEDAPTRDDAEATNNTPAPADAPSGMNALVSADENGEPLEGERPDHVPEAEEPFDFEQATITVQLKLLPRGEVAASRLVLVSATSHDQPPSRIISVAAADLALHPEITRLLADLAAEMPAKGARRRQELTALETAAANAKEEKERQAAETKRKTEEARNKAKTKTATATSGQTKNRPTASTQPRKLDTLPPLPATAELETARRENVPQPGAMSVMPGTVGSDKDAPRNGEAAPSVAPPKTNPLPRPPMKVSTPSLFD